MKQDWFFLIASFIIGIIVFITISSVFTERTDMYKQGQVDAMSGKIVFELKELPDGTRMWARTK